MQNEELIKDEAFHVINKLLPPQYDRMKALPPKKRLFKKEDEVLAAMQGSDFEQVERWFKVLAVGNSGAGKSFLLNVFNQANLFRHATHTDAVTTQLEYALYAQGTFGYILCDMPGLLHANGDAQTNAKAIEEAFQVLPDINAYVLFVMAMGPGGRLAHEDLVTCKALCEYVPSLNNSNTAVLVNQLAENDFNTALEMITYESDMMQQASELLIKDASVHFMRKVPAKNQKNWEDETMTGIKELLDDAVKGLIPSRMRPAAGASLVIPEQRVKEQLESAEKAIADMKAEQARDPWKELDGVDVDADCNDASSLKGRPFNDTEIQAMKDHAVLQGRKVFVIKKCGSKFDIWFKSTFDPETCHRKSRNDRRSYVYVK